MAGLAESNCNAVPSGIVHDSTAIEVVESPALPASGTQTIPTLYCRSSRIVTTCTPAIWRLQTSQYATWRLSFLRKSASASPFDNCPNEPEGGRVSLLSLMRSSYCSHNYLMVFLDGVVAHRGPQSRHCCIYCLCNSGQACPA